MIAPSTPTHTITFPSHGARCAAWHVPATTDALAGPRGRPCVVMAHGFGATRDSGLLTFAQPFADAGIDTLVFDYRGFGDSTGTPRQHVTFRRQREDFHAALDAARHLPDVDRDRIALWGTSYAGGHVVAVAAEDRRVAAAIALTPATDGLASLIQIGRAAGIGLLLRATGHGLRDAAHALAGRPPHHIPIVARPGDTAIITAPGALEAYTSTAGPTWRNEVCARTALDAALNRPTTSASRTTCPILFQIGTDDRVAPPAAALRTARRAGPAAQVHRYPVGHFDVYAGRWHQRVLADQIEFLSSALAPPYARHA